MWPSPAWTTSGWTPQSKGIAVSNAAGYSNEAVAELVLGMALSLSRHLTAVEQRCRTGGTKDGLVGFELAGKTVGIVGLGKIGSRTAELFHALGCPILATAARSTPTPPPMCGRSAWRNCWPSPTWWRCTAR